MLKDGTWLTDSRIDGIVGEFDVAMKNGKITVIRNRDRRNPFMPISLNYRPVFKMS
jgi:hypothetical protein